MLEGVGGAGAGGGGGGCLEHRAVAAAALLRSLPQFKFQFKRISARALTLVRCGVTCTLLFVGTRRVVSLGYSDARDHGVGGDSPGVDRRQRNTLALVLGPPLTRARLGGGGVQVACRSIASSVGLGRPRRLTRLAGLSRRSPVSAPTRLVTLCPPHRSWGGSADRSDASDPQPAHTRTEPTKRAVASTLRSD